MERKMLSEEKNQWKEKITRERLVEVSARLFMKKGYQATTMQEVADQLNIKKGSIYYYIKTKEDLLYNIVHISMNMLLDETKRIYNNDIDARKKISMLMDSHIKMISDNITLFSVSLYDVNKANAPLYWNDIVQLRDQYESIVQGVLDQGMQEGLFKSYNIKLSSFALLGMMNWLVRWYNPEYQANLDYIVETWTDIFLHGIAKQT